MRRLTAAVSTTRGLAATLILMLAVGALTVGALAIFTDSQAVGGNSFTAGTIDISVTPSTSIVSYSGNMAPGDSVTDDAVVQNGGNLQLRYAISSAATDADGKALKDGLTLAVRTADLVTLDGACNQFDGTSLYSGDLDGGTTGKIVGDAAQGSHTGDRTLNAGSSETLCFRVALPTAASDSYQGATTTATFTFSAEQTANN